MNIPKENKKPVSSYIDRKYKVIPYNQDWPRQFSEQSGILKNIFRNKAISIEHIGSTSIPGLAGKPTIDILVLVKDILIADKLKKQMGAVGYIALGEYVKKESRLFIKESNNIRHSNKHIFPEDHPHVKEMLELRDYFCNHPETVKEYSDLKTNLATKYPNNYGEYRKQKDKWMYALKAQIFAKTD